MEGPVQLANLRAPRLPPSLSGVFSIDGANVHIVDDKCILTFLYCTVLYCAVHCTVDGDNVHIVGDSRGVCVSNVSLLYCTLLQ